MRRARLILIVVAVVSLLLNAVFAGMAVRLWLRTDGGTPSAVFFALPIDLRQTLRTTFAEDNSQIHLAQSELQSARETLQSLLDSDAPDPVALEIALTNVRVATEKLQRALHAVIIDHYAPDS